jgi:eukaryotic-like serine/threonine-protein kinase
MDYKNALELFQTLLEEGDENLEQRLLNIITSDHEFFNEATKLISAYHANKKETLVNDLINSQAENLVDDSQIHELLNTQIAQYKLTKKLGQGGMGAVYLGERNDGQIEQKVAIKFVYPSIVALAGDDFLQKEAQHLANLEHTNIAKIFTVDTTDNELPYMVMEYVEGVPIDQYCDDNKLGLKARLKLFQKVCYAVQAAHQNMVIHSDIKPSNILVDKQGEPKLMDFGISRVFNQSNNNNDKVEVSSAVNFKAISKGYSSPELIEGKNITVMADIFSLGKVFKFCLRATKIDAEISAILNKATVKDVKNRFQSAIELEQDFNNYVYNFPVSVLKPSAFYSLKKIFIRHPISSSAIGVLSISVIFTLITLGVQYNKLLKQQLISKNTLSYLENIFINADPVNNQNHKITVKELLDTASEKMDVDQESEVVKRVNTAIASAYYGIAEYDSALQLFKTTGFKKDNLDEVGYDTSVLIYLGHIYEKKGLFSEALASFNRAEDQSLLSDESLIKVLLGQANVLIKLNQLSNTEIDNKIERSIRLAKKLHHNDLLAESYIQKANLAFEREKFTEAIALCKSVIELLEDNDVRLYQAYMTLAVSLKFSNEFEYVEDYFQKALNISFTVFGNNHDKTAHAYYSLGELYANKGEYEKAIEFFDKAVNIYRNIVPEGSAEFAEVLHNKSSLLLDIAEYQQAISTLDEVIAMRKKLYGELNPNIATTYNLLASVYFAIDNQELYEKYTLLALNVWEKTLFKGHSRLISGYSNVANLYVNKGNLGEAEMYVNKAVKMARVSPSTNIDLAYSLIVKGKILRSNLKIEESISAIREAISIVVATREDSFPAIGHFYHHLSLSYKAANQIDLAISSQIQATSLGAKHMGKDHPLTSRFQILLAELYSENSQKEKALAIVTDAYSLLKEKVGEEHKDTKQAKGLLDSL